MRIHIGAVACLLFVLQPQMGEAQEQSAPPTAQDLAGKWEGTPPMGGILEIDMEVSPSGEIKGKGLIRGGGTRAAHPSVSGEVKGQKVLIETYFPGPQSTVRYRCVWEERDTLQCRGPKGFQTVFKRR